MSPQKSPLHFDEDSLPYFNGLTPVELAKQFGHSSPARQSRIQDYIHFHTNYDRSNACRKQIEIASKLETDRLS